LDKQYDRVEKIYSETYAQSKNKEVQELTWEDAKEMMLENNLDSNGLMIPWNEPGRVRHKFTGT